MPKAVNLAGARYEGLTAITKIGRQKFGNMVPALWLVRCDCGAFEAKTSDQLTKNRTKHCKRCAPKFISKRRRLVANQRPFVVIKYRGDVQTYLTSRWQFSQKPNDAWMLPKAEAERLSKKIAKEYYANTEARPANLA